MLFPIIETKDIEPTPAIKPVITLIMLLLSHLVYACIIPSMYVGEINTIVNHKLNFK